MTAQRQRWEEWKAEPERFEELLTFIADGNGGLHKYAKTNGIAVVTLYDWVEADQSRSEKYARAREIGADGLVESANEAACDKTRDAQCRRVEMDMKKWQASKIRPRVYGDKTAVEHSGSVSLEQHLLGLVKEEGKE